MARLLRNCEHEDNNGKLERLAPAEAVNGYLEAVEKAGDTGQEFEIAGNSPGRGVSVGKYPQGLLARDG